MSSSHLLDFRALSIFYQFSKHISFFGFIQPVYRTLSFLTCQLFAHQLDDRLAVHHFPQSISSQDQELVLGSDFMSGDLRLGAQVGWGQVVWWEHAHRFADCGQDVSSCLVDSIQHLGAPFEADVAESPEGQQDAQEPVVADQRPVL